MFIFNKQIRPRTLSSIILSLICYSTYHYLILTVHAKDYYYTRIRNDPNHLRVSEEFKNRYVDDVKYVSKINGTSYEYYMSSSASAPNSIESRSYDELIFETIDKMSQHRLSPFYIHTYDNDNDKKLSFDPKIVSREACARDLAYLVDKIPKRYNHQQPQTSTSNNHLYDNDKIHTLDDADQMTPELLALFDSYAKQEAGLLMGNTYWVGGYDQCVNRHIFDLSAANAHFSSLAEAANFQDHLTSQDQQVISFKGRYCVASIKSKEWDPLIEERKLRGPKYFKTDRLVDNYSKLFRLQLGICLPDSCESSSIERHREEIKLLATSMLEARYSKYDLIDLYCLPDETSQLRSWSGSALYFVLFCCFWVLMLLAATVSDVFYLVALPSDDRTDAELKSPGSKHQRIRLSRMQKFVIWFSLRINYNKLMKVKDEESSTTNSKTETQNNTDSCAPNQQANNNHEANSKFEPDEIKINLRFLNALKVLIMFWIVAGHIMLLMIQTAKNILNSDALLNGLMHFLIGATFGVDLFFTITGFLTAYLIFRSGHAFKMRLSTWIGLSFHRYWRLAPMYLLAFWFSRSVAQNLGSGPLWDYGTSSITFRGLCNTESWWYPLTLTSNLHGLFDECMITSWYISCDMQFWLVSPIFIHLLANNPAYGWAATLASIFASCKFRYDAITTEQTARYDELIQPRADIFMRVSYDVPSIYTHPHHRVSAYLIGLLAGHFVYMVQARKWKVALMTTPVASATKQTIESTMTTTKTTAAAPTKSNQNSLRNFLGYFGLFLCILMSFISYLLSHYFPASLLKYSKPLASYAYSFDHFAMSLGASFCIIAMCFGQWPKLVRLLSHPNWTRVSKINYALLLLQCEAIYYQIFRYDQVPVAGTKELINILFNLLVTLYPVAFFVTLAFEFPLANLEKALINI